jgi:hypothetical protein
MRMQVVLSASVSLAMLSAGVATGSSHVAKGTIRKHIRFEYVGESDGHGNALEQASSFSPFVFAHHIVWHYAWRFECRAATTYTGSAKGHDIGCYASRLGVAGTSTFADDFHPESNCHATITTAPGGVVRLSGLFRNDAGTRLLVAASPPPHGAVLLATPSCGYPPDNLEWSGPLDVLHTTGDLTQGTDYFERTITGEITGFKSTTTQRSFFNTRLGKTTQVAPGEKRTTIKQILRQTSDLLQIWMTNEFDAANDSRPELNFAPVEMPFDGSIAVSVKDIDPKVLFTSHHALTADKPANLTLTPAPGALTFMRNIATPPELRVTVSFTPTGQSPIAYSTTFRPSVEPTITSAEFRGSTANPTIVIRGHNLGQLPQATPSGSISGQAGCPTISGGAGSDYGLAFGLADITHNWSAGRSWSGGTDCIGLIPISFSQTTASFKLGSLYTQNPSQFTLANGDALQVALNSAWRNVHVKYGATVTN